MLKYKRSLFLKKDFDGKKTVILNGKKYNQINENDFNHLLEKVKFGNSFSLPDRIIQDFISDGSIQPSLKNIKTFDNYDLENIIKPISDINFVPTKNLPSLGSIPQKIAGLPSHLVVTLLSPPDPVNIDNRLLKPLTNCCTPVAPRRKTISSA